MCLGGGANEGFLLPGAFQRLRHRRGPKKAICAVAASMLTAIYHMLRDGTVYKDLGAPRTTKAIKLGKLTSPVGEPRFH
jgi:hypothetical protein